MATEPTTVKAYLDTLPPDRKQALQAVRRAVNKGLGKGFKEGVQYRMIGWFVPHSLYPDGYHCDPRQPLPFASLASQKRHMALYLMCIYGDEKERAWFEKAWARTGLKLDMGKSCVRFKRLEDLPLDLITEAVSRVSVEDFIANYEAALAGTRAGARRKQQAARKTPAKKKSAKKKAARKPAARKRSTKKRATRR